MTKVKQVQKKIEQPIAVNKSLIKLEKVSFHLKYKTNFGQTIFIYGDHPSLGNNEMENAIPLQYVNEDYWVLHLNVKDTAPKDKKVRYHYFIQNEDGTRVFESGTDKSFSFDQCYEKHLVIIDSWNFTGFAENVFYTDPFQNVLLAPNASQEKEKSWASTITHVFRVKAPLVEPNQTVCIVGNDTLLGNWDISNAVVMKKLSSEQYFELTLDLHQADFPIVYKYGIYDVNNDKFVAFEEGNNRMLHEPVGKETVVLVNDGFIRHSNKLWKGAGVAIPVFSLKSKLSAGVGEFLDIKLLVDWATRVGVKLIQLLPINDTTATHTWMDTYPYAAISAFALHPMYIRLQDVIEEGQENILIPYTERIQALNALPEIDYEAVMQLKWEVLRVLYAKNGKQLLKSKSFTTFYATHKNWLEPYAVFSFLRDQYKTVDFNTWPSNAIYDQKAIDQLEKENYDAIAFYYFVQYHLDRQLQIAYQYAHQHGVVVKGDIPIGVYRYGVDAWQNKSLFHMDMQAGAPPDDFAINGQNWGFPTYNWEQMAKDDFAWWKSRFDQMKYYFDAFRIDHILGFFRIWSIPMDAVDGIMGHFVPAIPVTIHELNAKGIQVDQYRLTQPFINEEVVFEKFGYDNEWVKSTFLEETTFQQYTLQSSFDTQRKVEAYFAALEENDHHKKIKQGLFDLISNVILFKADNQNEFHFRFNMEQTSSFKHLDAHTQNGLKDLYIDYFFKRQDAAWEKEALHKLPKLRMSTNMLICGEDLGLVPSCVPNVMHQLGLLSLEVQRMPKANDKQFFHPNDAPYLSVVTPSSHDTSTVRGWWEEDRSNTQSFYNNMMGQWGEAPMYCEAWINKAILVQHLYSPAMWSIFQLQDYLGVDVSIRRENPHAERINIPANPKHYWRYRMHLTLESLINNQSFNDDWKMMIKASGR